MAICHFVLQFRLYLFISVADLFATRTQPIYLGRCNFWWHLKKKEGEKTLKAFSPS